MPVDLNTWDPLNRIALCCSGGGYRAAIFHLGAMSYLYRMRLGEEPLLHKVKALSTVSGGTITGIIYALMSRDGKSFPQIFDFLMQKLERVDLVREGLAKLNEGSTWSNENKRKNLINAFAEIYDIEFTNGETFDIFENMNKSHLELIAFNATEFYSGLIFRFQNDGRFGNFNHSVKEEARGEIELSDILAASSCFTGGFEPIEWPGDFIHSEAHVLKEEALFKESIGLMDGGIYDNQGLDSILISEERGDKVPFDLIIVSDVSSPYMTPFQFTKKMEHPDTVGWRSWNLDRLFEKMRKYHSSIRIGLLAFSTIVFSILFFRNFPDDMWTGAGAMMIWLALSLYFMAGWLKQKIGHQMKEAGLYLHNLLSTSLPMDDLESLDFKRIRFGHLESLVADRINALVTLVGEVFLKTVRRLVYGRLYDSEKHRYRRMSNLIRTLTRMDFEERKDRAKRDRDHFWNDPELDDRLNGNYEDVIGKNLENITETASRFGTKLWFSTDDLLKDQLNNLLITGQASMCFNLWNYLEELRLAELKGDIRLSEVQKKQLSDIRLQCVQDWQKFRENPAFMLLTS